MKKEFDCVTSPTPLNWKLFYQSLLMISDILKSTKFRPSARNQLAIQSLIEENLCAIYGKELKELKD